MERSILNMLHVENHIDNHKESGMDHLRNNICNSCITTENVRESHVLVLYTGGTIGMIRNENGGNIIIIIFSFLYKIKIKII